MDRSPRYPAVALADALVSIRSLYDKEKRTPVNGDVLSKALGFKSHSGPARTMIGSLRQYGLLERHASGLRVSDLGMKALHSLDGSKERVEAITEAALTPELFRELHESHADASEDAIKSHLILKKGFLEQGARLAASAYKDTLALAKPNGGGYNPKKEEKPGGSLDHLTPKIGDLVQWESQGVLQFQEPMRVRAVSEDGQWVFVDGSETGFPIEDVIVEKAAAGPETKKTDNPLPLAPPKMPLPPSIHAFSWPLSKDVLAEVKLTGEFTADHLEMLRSYLDLAKKAMA